MRFVNLVPSPTECCIYILLLLFPHLVKGAITFTSPYGGTSVYGAVGSSVTFTWSFSGAFRKVRWGLKKTGQNDIDTLLVSLDSSGMLPVIPPAEYSGRVNGIISLTSSSGQAAFTLSNIKTTDERFFGCWVESSDIIPRKQFDSVKLVVQEPPVITDPTSANVNYNEGAPVNISCEATGKPDPHVMWFHNGQVKRSGSKQAHLTFITISKKDTGMYTCRANSSAGSTEKQVNIVVNYKPEGTTITLSKSTALQGENVTLTCHVTAANPAVSEYRFYLNDTVRNTSKSNSLTIIDVQLSKHYGKYKCVAHNDAGDGQSNAVVLDINVPATIKSLTGNVTVNETNSIDLKCDVYGYPVPAITWKKDKKELQQHTEKDLRIDSSSKSDSGKYTCAAQNFVRMVEMETFVTVNYRASITTATSSATESWIGQTVKLMCVTDGVPTPVLTWKKPDGTDLKKVTATENAVDAVMKEDEDFGLYTCQAENGVGAAATSTVEVKQIKAPSPPSITSTTADIKDTSLKVKWTAPADDGGSPITAYRVFILQGGNVIKNENITDLSTKVLDVGNLNKDTNYTVKVYARNYVFEGNASLKTIKTKYEGVPAAPEIKDLPASTKVVEVTITWNEPQNNGAPITQYTVYQRTVRDDGSLGDWNKFNEIKAPWERKATLQLVKGKAYEFVVTATNKFGESLKEERKIQKIMVLGGVPAAVQFTAEEKDGFITLKWTKPETNGASIIKYSVYQRFVNDKKWRCEDISDTSKLDYDLKGDEGKEYEFVVTATNKYGESSKTANIQTVKVLKGTSETKASAKPPDTQSGNSCDEQKTVLHAAYIVVIVSLVLVILILLVMLRRTRRCLGNPKTNRRNKCPRCGDLVAMNPVAVHVEDSTRPLRVVHSDDAPTYANPAGGDYMSLHPSTRSWEISRKHVNIIKVIGKGAFSQVAQATVRNLRGSQESITVAVKMLKANAPASDRKDLLSELELMKNLKPHPHVIKLMGCVTDSDPLLVLIEYVPFGDLLGYLRKSRGLHDTYYKDPDVKPQTNLTSEQVMRFAWQIADGMCYLASKKIIHRDLAARNVLVGEGEKCKVTDFGMARNVHQDDIYSRKSRGRLPVKWTAYEALMYGTYTTQSDVWSYGILLYEILTVGGSPYPDINARQIAEKLQEGYRMPKPRHVDEKLHQIMMKCWEENPNDRPTFEKLRKTMKDMERNHKTYVNLNKYDNSLYANIYDLTAE